MLKAYKYCIQPTEEQKQQLAKFFGCARFVYNLAAGMPGALSVSM
jgi:putative transposase